MGNIQGIPPKHIEIYKDVLKIQSPKTRVSMINTLLNSEDHYASAKQSGVYTYLTYYVQCVREGAAIPLLPGETRANDTKKTEIQIFNQQVQSSTASQKGNDKAMNYFSACLRILGLEEEVALTEEALKSSYKKVIIKAHPDKGGSEKEFEAVTKAYAYLGEILLRIKGGRKVEGKVESVNVLNDVRDREADKWKHIEPVNLNPNKLDLNSFNTMFEKMRMPDPEQEGYGDWLRGEGKGSEREKEIDIGGPKFSGKFNREVFENAFRDDLKGKQAGRPTNALTVSDMTLSARYATEIGRGKVDDYTAANDGGLQYTDLRKAYTEYNTFTQNVADVKVENKSYEQMLGERKSAPQALRNEEWEGIQQAERIHQKAEEERKLRLAQQALAEESYFKKMQRLVITNK